MSYTFKVGTDIPPAPTHKQNVAVISSVIISGGSDPTDRNRVSLGNPLNFPMKLSSYMGQPWTIFTEHEQTNPKSPFSVNKTDRSGKINNETLGELKG